MKNIYKKLEIPEPSADLESKIIAASLRSSKKDYLPRFAVIAACLLLIFMVLPKQDNSQALAEAYIADVEFYDEQYGFYEETS